jgi:outer membrane biosynthesis protein TonB
MRFHSIAVLCALAAPAVDAFGVPRTQVTSFSSRPTTATFAKSNEYDFDFKIVKPAEEEIKGKKGQKKAKAAPTPAPVVESPAPAPAPVVVQEKKADKPKKEKKVKEPKTKPDVKNIVVAPTPAPVPVPQKVPATKTVTKDPNAVLTGVALGGAPLILAPLVALAAGRSTLINTKGRRDEIAKNIEEFNAAEAARKAKKNTDIDLIGLGKAVVSRLT